MAYEDVSTIPDVSRIANETWLQLNMDTVVIVVMQVILSMIIRIC